MTTSYVVVRYVPDPVTDERINIGVIAFDGVRIRGRFVDDWRRARQFGASDISFLRAFAEQVELAGADQPVLDSFPGSPRLTPDLVRQMAGAWINSIQFSEPRASLLPIENLLDDASRRFLREGKRVGHYRRGRRAAVEVVARSVAAALEVRGGGAADLLVKRNHVVSGALEAHVLAVAVGNSQVYYAADALSFEIADRRELESAISSTAWALDDIRKRDRQVPLAVVALSPGANQQFFDRARHIFTNLHAKMLTDATVDAWAKQMARRVPIEVLTKGGTP